MYTNISFLNGENWKFHAFFPPKNVQLFWSAPHRQTLVVLRGNERSVKHNREHTLHQCALNTLHYTSYYVYFHSKLFLHFLRWEQMFVYSRIDSVYSVTISWSRWSVPFSRHTLYHFAENILKISINKSFVRKLSDDKTHCTACFLSYYRTVRPDSTPFPNPR